MDTWVIGILLKYKYLRKARICLLYEPQLRLKLWLGSLFDEFLHQMRAVLETIEESFAFAGRTELATEIPYGVVIIQG